MLGEEGSPEVPRFLRYWIDRFINIVLVLGKWGSPRTSHPILNELLRLATTTLNIELCVAGSLNLQSALCQLIWITRHTAKLWYLHWTSYPFNFILYCKSSGKFYKALDLYVRSSWNVGRGIRITRGAKNWRGKMQFISLLKSCVSLTRINTTLTVAAILDIVLYKSSFTCFM